MKQLAAIAFSLLLIVAQTFAVTATVSSGVSVARPDCCDVTCHCCVSQSSAPSVPPIESATPVAVQNQFALMPVAVVPFALAALVDKIPPASASTEFRAATSPIFQRNCSLLI